MWIKVGKERSGYWEGQMSFRTYDTSEDKYPIEISNLGVRETLMTAFMIAESLNISPEEVATGLAEGKEYEFNPNPVVKELLPSEHRTFTSIIYSLLHQRPQN